MNKTAIYPGTFDPITFGHIDVIKKSLKLFDKIVVGVSDESNKNYLFSSDERIEIVNKALFKDLKLNRKNIKLNGVGYRANVQGKKITLTLGFSHPVEYQLPENVEAKSEGQTEFNLTSADKQLLGQVCAEIRAFRPPEPYKGKGIFIDGEHVVRKERKKAAAG